MTIQVECSHCRHLNVIEVQGQKDRFCERCKCVLAGCPQCGRPRSGGAVICVHCGMDFRTGKKVVPSPAPQHFGDFTLHPVARDEWLLSMRRRFLGIPVGAKEFAVVGFNKVYYDTVDSWSAGVAPTAAPGTTAFSLSALPSLLRLLFAILLLCGGNWLLARLAGNSDTQLLFEVGFLGPREKFLRLRLGRNSAKMRAIATWLSESLGFPVERRDRRSPQ
jgi:hypothetical protein